VARPGERRGALAIDAELDPEFSEKFIRFVIDEVIRHHQRAAKR
jgi:chorismate mutase